MNKLFILVGIILLASSCTSNEESTLNPVVTETKNVDTMTERGLYLGHKVIDLAYGCDELEISDSTLELMQEFPDDVIYVIWAIHELEEQQPIFGDVIEGYTEYDLYLEWLKDWEVSL